jgi:hypothetical protein
LPFCARCKRMRPSVAVLLLLSYIFAVVAARAADENIGATPPPPLTPGQAPPLPKPGLMAEPRSSNQVGFPTVLTEYVVSPARSRLPGLHWVRSCSSSLGSQVTALSPVPIATIRIALSPMAGPYQSVSTGASANATPPTVLNALYNKHRLPLGQCRSCLRQLRCSTSMCFCTSKTPAVSFASALERCPCAQAL